MLAASSSYAVLVTYLYRTDQQRFEFLSPTTGKPGPIVILPGLAYRIVAGSTHLWLTYLNGEQDSSVTWLDPKSGKTDSLSINRNDPLELTIGGGSVWLSDTVAQQTFRLTPETGTP
jgi:hypothetical protein